jgi:uncharacterized membrane protein
MGTVERSIQVNVPPSTAYEQWARFEAFPQFMEGVEEISQIDAHLFWRVKLAGRTREFHAEVVEQRPDERIAWRSSEGAMHSGVVTFHSVGDSQTRVSVTIQEEPDGVAERVGEALGLLEQRVEGDLERFKRMMETREGWHAEIERPGGRFERAAEVPGGRAPVPPRGAR